MKNEFGLFIKKIRNDKGLSLRKVCDSVKNEKGDPISVSYLNDIERGYRKPPVGAIVVQIAEVLGTDKTQLLELADKPDPELEEAIRDPKMAEMFRRMMEKEKKNEDPKS